MRACAPARRLCRGGAAGPAGCDGAIPAVAGHGGRHSAIRARAGSARSSSGCPRPATDAPPNVGSCSASRRPGPGASAGVVPQSWDGVAARPAQGASHPTSAIAAPQVEAKPANCAGCGAITPPPPCTRAPRAANPPAARAAVAGPAAVGSGFCEELAAAQAGASKGRADWQWAHSVCHVQWRLARWSISRASGGDWHVLFLAGL